MVRTYRALRLACFVPTSLKTIVTCFALFFVSLGSGSSAISSPRSLKLASGWHLIASPKDHDGSLFRLYKAQGLSLWSAAVFEAPGRKNSSGAGVMVELEAFKGQGGVWVFAPSPVELREAEIQDASLRPAGWNVLRVTQATRLEDPNIETVFHWDRIQEVYTRVRPGEWLHPNEGYWAQFLKPGVFPFSAQNEASQDMALTEASESRDAKPPRPPAAFSATSRGEMAILSWTKPTRLDDGTAIPEGAQLSYQVDRDGVQVGRSTEAEFRDAVPKLDRVYRYEVRAILKTGDEPALTSDASDPISLFLASPKPASADHFEVPSVASDENASVALPQVAVSGRGEQIFAHLVYVVRATENRSAELRYRLSPKAATSQSFETLHRISAVSSGWQITDVGISALKDKVSVAWIQRREGDKPKSEIWVAQSGSNGERFGAPKKVRANAFWKRGLDIAYDRFGRLHLVWGEANKVYYMKDLDGEVENVFDVVVREKNDIVVSYRMLYKKECDAPDDPCDCFETAEEHYTYALEEDENSGELLGPYRYRLEEAWVYNPSLRIDDKKVSIIASQDRMWDNRPIRNPHWRGEYGPVVPPRVPSALDKDAWCGQEGSRHNQQGFMQVWSSRRGPALPYEPVKISHEERAHRLSIEEDPASAFAHYYGDGEEHFLSYDPRVAHDKDWYFYLYDGSWHEEDQIRVAQRPLVSRAWSEETATPVEVPVWPIDRGLLFWTHQTLPIETGWRRGSWKGGHLQNWRLSVVSSREASAENDDGRVVRPKLVGDQQGLLVAVYEDGASKDPNQPGHNTIAVNVSTDGGIFWSQPTVVGQGYMPDAALLADGEMAVVYYEARDSEDASDLSKIQLSRSRNFKNWARTPLSLQPPRAIHWETHGAQADALVGVPSLAAYEDLLVVSWVRQAEDAFAHDAVVTTRLSNDTDVRRFDISHDGDLITGKSARFTVAAVNKYGMRVNASGVVQVTKKPGPIADATPNPSPSAGATTKSAPDFGALTHRSGAVVSESGAPTSEHSESSGDLLGHPTELSGVADGQGRSALALAPVSTVYLEGGEAELWTVVDDTETTFFVQDADGGLSAETTSKAFVAFTAHASGNYDRALRTRNALLRRDQTRGWVYQVEYAPDYEDPEVAALVSRDSQPNGWAQGHLEDARHLAGFERVWVYTQGIALAQFSRRTDAWSVEVAQGMARYLCDRAQWGVFEGEEIIRGWPFSWNTLGDTWRDARVVTGATAWAIHGLGSFVASEAYRRLEEGDRSAIQFCYHRALHGLKEHRRQVRLPSTGETVTLMTAGWTTTGLQRASTPALLPPPFEEAEGTEWAYYSVLDAIGYDSFDEAEPPLIKRWQDGKSIGALELTKSGLAVLREPVLAENIVTEHNLDVLSVLNHALSHHKKTGLTDVEELRAWRDELRAGIFDALWDERGWKGDLRDTLDGEGISSERRAHIEDTLEHGSLGRIVTGGELLGDTEPKVLAPSPHVAIDNCSWLSLSVDFDALPADSVYVERLARCLEFTELHFAKEITFEGRSYYGAHYFQNAFKDPYIDESELQESSFHLEATTGLILGLHRFAMAHPSHKKAEWFRARANTLWDGVQSFVTDHGFPYSSQRIHNLSTLLSSSTAVIWFIDVYEASPAIGEVRGQPWKPFGVGDADTVPQALGVELNLDGQNVFATQGNHLFEQDEFHEPFDVSFKMTGLELSGARLKIHDFKETDDLVELSGVLSLCDGGNSGCNRSVEIDPPALALGVGQLLALSFSDGLDAPLFGDDSSNPWVTQVGSSSVFWAAVSVTPLALYYYWLLGLGVGPETKGLAAALPWIVTLGVMKGFGIPFNFSKYNRISVHAVVVIAHAILVNAFYLEQSLLPIQPLNQLLWQADAAFEAGGEAIRFHIKAPKELDPSLEYAWPLAWFAEKQQEVSDWIERLGGGDPSAGTPGSNPGDVTNTKAGIELCIGEACSVRPINVATAWGAVEIVSSPRIDATGLTVDVSYDTKGEEHKLQFYLVSDTDEVVGFYETATLSSKPTQERVLVSWLENMNPAEGQYQIWVHMIEEGTSCIPGCLGSYAYHREWLHVEQPHPDEYTVSRLSFAPHEAESERIALILDLVGELQSQFPWLVEHRELVWIPVVSRNAAGKEPYRTLFAQVDSSMDELKQIEKQLDPKGEEYKRQQALGANTLEKWFREHNSAVHSHARTVNQGLYEISVVLEEQNVRQVVEDPWGVESSGNTEGARFRFFRDRLLADLHPFGVETLLDREEPTLFDRLAAVAGGASQTDDYIHYLEQTRWPATEWSVYRWLVDAESGVVRAYADGFVESYGALGVEAFQRLDEELLATSFAGGSVDFGGLPPVGRYYPLGSINHEKLEELLRRSGYDLKEIRNQIQGAKQSNEPLARDSHLDRIRIVSGKTLRDPVPVNLWPGVEYHLGVSYVAGGKGRELLVRLEHVDTGHVAHAVKPVEPTDGYEFASLPVTMPENLQSGRYRWDAQIQREGKDSSPDAPHVEVAITPFFAHGLSGSKTPGEFIRVELPLLKTAITRYRSPETNLEISLVSMIHVGRVEYYKEASRYLNEMDLVLAEGVSLTSEERDPDEGRFYGPTERERIQMRNAIAGFALQQSWFGLSSQRIEGPPELFLHVDFDAKTIAEQAKEIERTTGKRDSIAADYIQPHPLEYLFTIAASRLGDAAFQTIAPELRDLLFKEWFARPYTLVEDGFDREVIIVARNNKVLSVLDGLLEERDSGRIAILYGAAHMPHFEKELFSRGFVRTEAVWLTSVSTNLEPADAASLR